MHQTKFCPPFLHIREAYKKYIEAIEKMKNTSNPPMFITLKRNAPTKQNTKELPEDHPFELAKYIIDGERNTTCPDCPPRR